MKVGERITLLLSLAAVVLILFAGCSKAEPAGPTVYSFSGENGQFSVSNGVIVLDSGENIFSGGELRPADGFPDNVMAYSTEFYIQSDDGKDIILSGDVQSGFGEPLDISGKLGSVSWDSSFEKVHDTDALEGNLFFELTTEDANGEETVYQLQLELTKVTPDK